MEDVLMEKKEIKPVSLVTAITLTALAFVTALITFIGKDFGYSNFSIVFGEPVVFQSYITQALGGSLMIPTIHVGIFSFFKSKRNSPTRRRIFIGWSIVIIIVQSLSILTKH